MNDRLPSQPELSTPAAASDLAARLRAVRAATVALAAPLSAEDCTIQSMPDASPSSGILRTPAGFSRLSCSRPTSPGIGSSMPRFGSSSTRITTRSAPSTRGRSADSCRGPRSPRFTLTGRTSIKRCRACSRVRPRSLACSSCSNSACSTSSSTRNSSSPTSCTSCPAIRSSPRIREATALPDAAASPPLEWIGFAEGVVEIGHDGTGFAFDNETPRHRQYLDAFALASRPVTNAEYAGFVADGGYRRPELWLSEGWDWLQANRIVAPMYWEDDGGCAPVHAARHAAARGRRAGLPREPVRG